MRERAQRRLGSASAREALNELVRAVLGSRGELRKGEIEAAPARTDPPFHIQPGFYLRLGDEASRLHCHHGFDPFG